MSASERRPDDGIRPIGDELNAKVSSSVPFPARIPQVFIGAVWRLRPIYPPLGIAEDGGRRA